MPKKFIIRAFVVAFVVLLGFGVWAGSRYAGGSFFLCVPGTDLNGDGQPDCSYIGQFLWKGGQTSSNSAADVDLVVTQATLLCDNNGTAFKVTFGKGTRLPVSSLATQIGQVDGNGQFSTFSRFPNEVADFPSLNAFREFWFDDTNNHCRNKTQTEVKLFITTVQMQGTFCNDKNDPSSCVESPILTCTTNNPFGEPPVVFSCKEGS